MGGALATARAGGAFTVLVSSNPATPLAAGVDVNITLDTGPEVVTGSTRLKAGTAQKLVLNSFSTALMIAVGRTYGNLMVSVVATNAKLRERTVRILREATDLAEDDARILLERSDGDLKAAVVAALADVEPARAHELLAATAGSVRAALAAAREPIRDAGATGA